MGLRVAERRVAVFVERGHRVLRSLEEEELNSRKEKIGYSLAPSGICGQGQYFRIFCDAFGEPPVKGRRLTTFYGERLELD